MNKIKQQKNNEVNLPHYSFKDDNGNEIISIDLTCEDWQVVLNDSKVLFFDSALTANKVMTIALKELKKYIQK